MRLIAKVNASLDTSLGVRTVFEAPTVRSLSYWSQTNITSEQELVPVQPLKMGTGIPLFCIHSAGGASWSYQVLGNYLECPIIGIQQVMQDEGAEPRSIRDMVENYADRIQEFYPTGPYNLLGWSFGGVVAHELAVELQRRGCVLARLILLDAQPNRGNSGVLPNPALEEKHILQEILRFYRISAPKKGKLLTYGQIEELVREQAAVEISQHKQLLDLLVQNITNNIAMYRAHKPGVFDGHIVIFSAAQDAADRASSVQSWRPYVTGEVAVHSIDCTHQEMLTAESVSMYGKHLKDLLALVPTST
jgi:thioesterase domain-containing protein